MTRPSPIPVLEIGGTHVTAALVDSDTWQVNESRRQPLDSTGSREQIVGALIDAALPLGAHPRWGVAIPGPFDYRTGIGHFGAEVAKFEALADFDLGAALRTGVPTVQDGESVRRNAEIVFINDADAFGVGEVIAGAGRGHARVVCLTLGTGIGSAFVADGSPVDDGPDVPPDGEAHQLSWNGIGLEETVSRRAIRRRYTELTGEQRDVHEIADLVRTDDQLAAQVFEECFGALGSCLAPWIDRFGASALVLGGSIAESFDLVEPPIRAGLREARPGLEITARRAENPETAALVGAAHHAVR